MGFNININLKTVLVFVIIFVLLGDCSGRTTSLRRSKEPKEVVVLSSSGDTLSRHQLHGRPRITSTYFSDLVIVRFRDINGKEIEIRTRGTVIWQ